MTATCATGVLTHPDWCLEHLCTVSAPLESGFALGDHIGKTGHLATAFGSELRLGLTREHADSEVRVLHHTSALDEPENHSHYEWLEPEEARLLARRLLEAADRVEAATRG